MQSDIVYSWNSNAWTGLGGYVFHKLHCTQLKQRNGVYGKHDSGTSETKLSTEPKRKLEDDAF